MENDINVYRGKTWSAIDRLITIWKSYLSDKIKWEFFQVVAMSVLWYGYTTWIRTKLLKKKLRIPQGCCVLF